MRGRLLNRRGGTVRKNCGSRLLIGCFLGVEGLLYGLFLYGDLTGGDTVLLKYGSILLCLLFSVFWSVRGGNQLVTAALAFTLGADTFLLLLYVWYLAGVLLFGPVWGFVYNYVGICIGSLLAFAVARNCGKPLLSLLFSEKTIQRYSHWTEEKGRFARLFALAIFLPVAPDDFLCYLAGTTEMSWGRYTAIILLCKPFAIALYSLGLTLVWNALV